MKDLDKIWHFSVSAGLVPVIFLVLSACSSIFRKRRRQRQSSNSKAWNLDLRLIISAVFAFLVGVAKEVADILSSRYRFPWCNPTCSFDWMDLLLDANGVLAGVLIVIGAHLTVRYWTNDVDEPCDETAVMTIDPDCMDKDEEGTVDTREHSIPSSVVVVGAEEKRSSCSDEQGIALVGSGSEDDVGECAEDPLDAKGGGVLPV